MFNFDLLSPIDLEIKKIQKNIYENPTLHKINKHIGEREPFNCSKKFLIKYAKYDYIFDGLNIEGGTMNSFLELKKIIKLKKNKLCKKKILIIIRSPLKYQTRKEKKDCIKLVNQFNNVNVMYIHTVIRIKNKYYKLIESCRNNPYCTHKEKKSRELLCVTPLIIAKQMRALHNMCEVDDLLAYYFTLCFNSKIVSRTEKYSLNVKAKNIESFKLFMNIPITFYSCDGKCVTERFLYIDPLHIYKNLTAMYKDKPLIENQVITIKKGISLF